MNGCHQNEIPNSWWKLSIPLVNILWSVKLFVCKKQMNNSKKQSKYESITRLFQYTFYSELFLTWSVHITLLIQISIFSIEKAIIWIVDFGLEWISCGLLWCFHQLFRLSFWRHPFTAEDPLVSKWCNAKVLQICSREETRLLLELPEVVYIFRKFSFLIELLL